MTAATTNTFAFLIFYQTKDSCQKVQKEVQTQEDLQAKISTLENQLSTSLDQTAKFFLECEHLEKDLLQEKDKNQKLQENYRKLNEDFQFVRREGNVNLETLERLRRRFNFIQNQLVENSNRYQFPVCLISREDQLD